MTRSSCRPYEIALVLLAMAIFGATFAIAKVALLGFRPGELAMLRFLIAAGLLAPINFHQPRAVACPPLHLHLPLAVVGFIGVTLAYMLENTALRHVNASVASFIVTAMPAFLAVLAVPFLGEPFTRGKAGALALATAGIALVSYNGDPGVFRRSAEMLGVGLMTLVAVVEALATIVSKKTLRRIPPLTFTFWVSLYGAIGLAPFAAWQFLTWTEPRTLAAAQIGALLYLAIGASLFSFYAYYNIMSKMEASRAAFFLYLIPIFGTITGIAMFHEPITLWFGAGSVLIFAGVTIIQRRAKEKPAAVVVG